MSIKGLPEYGYPMSMLVSSFRTSCWQPEGSVPAHIVEGIIADINQRLWTVDVLAKFDQLSFLNVQVSSPYMHSTNGEGIYVMPEIGAKCHICIPSHGPPPYVLDFIMPSESLPADNTDEKSGGSGDTEGFTYAGGRPKVKPGDIFIRGRDGNFVILHRGGVLQIGSTELAQRIYIPLENLVTDISQNYRHYNTGGSIQWYLAPERSETNPPTILKETYRLLAGDARGSIRIAIGKIKDFVEETDKGANSDLNQLAIGGTANILCEVVYAPDGFGADNGSIDGDTPKKTLLRYFFDEGGSAFLRSEGSILVKARQRVKLASDGDFDIETGGSFSIKAENTCTINGGKSMNLTSKITKLNGGSKPVGHVGSIVDVPLVVLTSMAPIPVVPGAVPGSYMIAPGTPITFITMTGSAVLKGTIKTGNPTILV